MVMMHDLPAKQREVLHFIVRNIYDKKESPTMQEIADGNSISIQNAQNVVNVLVKKGKIKKNKFQARSITLVE